MSRNTVDSEGLLRVKMGLEGYVESVAEMERENIDLKDRIKKLEFELDDVERKCVKKIESAKEIWRDQAVAHGRKQRQAAIVECEKLMLRFQTDLRRQRFSTDIGSRAALLSSIFRAEYTKELITHEKSVFEALALSSIAKSPVTIQDFDIEDRHIGITNRTDVEIILSGCRIRFRNCNHSYEFPDDSLIGPHASISLWYGKYHNAVRRAKELGSFYWGSDAAASADEQEIVELIDRRGRVFASTKCNRRINSEVSAISKLSEVVAAPDGPSSILPVAIKENLSNPLISPIGKKAKIASATAASSCKKRPRERDQAAEIESAIEDGDDGFITPKWKRSRRSVTSQKLSDSHSAACASTSLLDGDNQLNLPDLSQLDALKDPLSFAAPRPRLKGRHQGMLSIWSVMHKDDKVGVRIVNRGHRSVDISCWKLVCIGYPVQELFIPEDTVLPKGGKIGLVSQLDEESKMMIRGLSVSPPRPTAGPSNVDPSTFSLSADGVDVNASTASAGNIPSAARSTETENQDHLSGTTPRRSRSPRPMSMEQLQAHNNKGNKDEKEEQQLTVDVIPDDALIFSEAQIVEVTGLDTLPSCDVFSICLVDPSGQNIAQFDAPRDTVNIFNEPIVKPASPSFWQNWATPVMRNIQSFSAPLLFGQKNPTVHLPGSPQEKAGSCVIS